MSRPGGNLRGHTPAPWRDPLAISALILLAVAIGFGGASRLNAWQVAIVELSALPLMALSAGRAVDAELWPRHRILLTICAGVIVIPLLQLVPLPSALWTALPGREDIALALSLADVTPTWNATTVSPDRTLASALALTPPMALLLAVLAGPQQLSVLLVRMLLAAAVVSILLGATQLASGTTRFYPWPTTDAGHVVGFFANRNHFATMVVMTLPFAAVLATRERQRRKRVWIQSAAVGYSILVMIALAGGGSRAGMLLFWPAAAIAAAIWMACEVPRLSRKSVWAMLGGATIIIAMATFAFAPVLDRFDGATGEEGRLGSWKVVLQTIPTYLPVGAGTGAFDPVYRSVEPLARLDPTFLNQAHNDWLEILLESGLFGATAVAAFCGWWGLRTFQVWNTRSDGSHFGRAASAAILTVLLHSTVDYPVRTLTIAVTLALCVGILERSAVSLPDLRPAG